MIEAVIQGNNILFKSIIHTAPRYSDKDKFTLLPSRGKRDIEINKALFCLGLGEHNITHENNKIYIKYYEEGDPVDCEFGLKKYQELLLKGDSQEIIDNFLTVCMETYNKEVNEVLCSESQITCFIYDVDFWTKLNKIYKRDINTLCFDKNEHMDLLESINDFLSVETEREYRSLGIPYKMNVLLEGYPGTGKTSLIYAIASSLNMNISMISFDSKMNDIALMKAIKRVPENSIIIFEDIDVLFKDRKDNDTFKGISFSGLLNCLDGFCSAYKQIIFMTTNFCCNLDIALKRPGRVDYRIHFDYATKNQKKILFQKFCKDNHKEEKEFLKKISKLKLTTAVLQQFLFSNRKNESIMENIEELEELVSKNSYDSSNLNLYT